MSDSIGSLVRAWHVEADEYHMCQENFAETIDGVLEVEFVAFCNATGTEEDDWLCEGGRYDSSEKPPQKMCRNCARICRNVAEEGEG